MDNYPDPDRPTTATDATDDERRVLTARGPEDLLAAVPVVLGFEPSESAVMLTFGGSHTFHARVDLPQPDDPADDLDAMVDLLLAPARRHVVRSVAFMIYTTDPLLGRRVCRELGRRFERVGIAVHALIRADGSRWFLPNGGHGVPAHGVPYDLALHPFRVQSVVDGQVTLGSRDELAATLATDIEAAAVVAAVVVSLGPGAASYDAAEVAACVTHHLADGSVFTDAELASVSLAIRSPRVREAAWGPVRRESARDHVRLWTDAVRRTPPDLIGGPAAVLAFSAWLAGHGALSWCALDRCHATDEDNTLAELVADLLQAAVPPATWTPEMLAG